MPFRNLELFDLVELFDNTITNIFINRQCDAAKIDFVWNLKFLRQGRN